MVVFVDDFFLRMLGLSVPGLDMIWILELLRGMSYKEMYNEEKIKNRIKENRLLYELGEIGQEEYEEERTDLMRKLEMARRIDEMDLKVRSDRFAV